MHRNHFDHQNRNSKPEQFRHTGPHLPSYKGEYTIPACAIDTIVHSTDMTKQWCILQQRSWFESCLTDWFSAECWHLSELGTRSIIGVQPCQCSDSIPWGALQGSWKAVGSVVGGSDALVLVSRPVLVGGAPEEQQEDGDQCCSFEQKTHVLSYFDGNLNY